MPINFLDNVQFNQNQLLGARLQVESANTNVTNPVSGQLIYNSTSNKINFYNGTGWISVPDGTGIGGSGTVGTIPVFNGVSEITDSRLETTGSGSTQSFLFNTNGDVTAKGNFSLDGGGGIKDKDGQLGTSGQLLSSTGTQLDWINAPVSYTNWKIDSNGNNNPLDVNDGDLVVFGEFSSLPGIFPQQPSKTSTTITYGIGLHTKNMTTAAPSAYSTDVLLWGTNTGATDWKVQQTHVDDIPVSAWGQATASVDMGDNLIIKVLDPVSAQDAATKNYVDNAIVGGFNVKGGFNANTGITAVAGTNLYTNTAIAVGDYYVVTVAGNFFGQASTPLTPGDSVLVQTAASAGSAAITDFAVIQSDTDLATVNSVGIGNVNVNGPGALDGLKLSYSAGTGTVGVDIANNVVASSALPEMAFLVYDGNSTGANLSLDIDLLASYVNGVTSFAGTSSSGTTHTFNHNLNTFDVIVQTYNNAVSTQETIYASVVRTSVNQVVVTTAASANIRCLIQKIV